jgi:hypothetical protein
MHHAWLAHPFMLRLQHLSTLDKDTMANTDRGTTDMSIKAGTGNRHECRANELFGHKKPYTYWLCDPWIDSGRQSQQSARGSSSIRT